MNDASKVGIGAGAVLTTGGLIAAHVQSRHERMAGLTAPSTGLDDDFADLYTRQIVNADGAGQRLLQRGSTDAEFAAFREIVDGARKPSVPGAVAKFGLQHGLGIAALGGVIALSSVIAPLALRGPGER